MTADDTLRIVLPADPCNLARMASKQQARTGAQVRKQPRKAAKSAVKTGANASRASVGNGNDSDPPSPEFVPSVPPIRGSQREEWLRAFQSQILAGEDLLVDSRGRPVSAVSSCADEDLCDQEAIANYLDLPNAMDVAGLAANLVSTRPEGVGRAVALSLDIFLRSREVLASWRDELAKTMDATSIDVLLKRLVPDIRRLRTERSRLKADPVIGPVLARKAHLEHIAFSQDDPKNVFDCDNPRSSIKKPAILAGRSAQRLPCPLDVALRCVADIPSCFASEHLKKIFITFLGLSPMLTPKQRANMAEGDRMVLRISDSGSRPTAGLFGKRRSEIFAEVNYRLNFRPPSEAGNSEVPSSVTRRAERDFRTYWDGENPVSSPARLAWIAEHFPPFWERYGAEYRRIREEAKRLEDERSRKMSEGVQKRDLKKWMKRTWLFAESLQQRSKSTVRLTRDDVDHAILDFKDRAGQMKDMGLADSRSMEKCVDILRAIANQAIRDSGPDAGATVLADLRQSAADMAKNRAEESRTTYHATGGKRRVSRSKTTADYKSITESTIMECIRILRENLGDRLPAPSLPRESQARISSGRGKTR